MTYGGVNPQRLLVAGDKCHRTDISRDGTQIVTKQPNKNENRHAN